MKCLSRYKNRADLLDEILNSLYEWPELHRRIFIRNHYHGQSPETISRSIHLDEKKIDEILKQCNHKLYNALREFRADECCNHPNYVFIPTSSCDCRKMEMDKVQI